MFFICAMEIIFSFGERWTALLNGTVSSFTSWNILTIAHINIHYLYNIQHTIKFLHKIKTISSWPLDNLSYSTSIKHKQIVVYTLEPNIISYTKASYQPQIQCYVWNKGPQATGPLKMTVGLWKCHHTGPHSLWRPLHLPMQLIIISDYWTGASNLSKTSNMWCDQAKSVGSRKYWFWDIAKQRKYFLLFPLVLETL